MQTEMPFFESFEDALKACVQALGGAKLVGAKLWPDKSMEDARNYLLACLNSERSEKLGYTQLIFVFREAKAAGFHAAFDWVARECGYDARPITDAEEMDRLAAVVEQSSKTLSAAVATLERIQRMQNHPMTVAK